MFPEGTRTRPGSLGHPKRGVGRLALESGAPVVPVAVIGTEAVRKGWRIRPHKVRIRVGRALHFPRVDEPSPQLAQAVTERIWPCVMLQWEWLGGLPPLRRAVVVGAGSCGISLASMLARGGLEVELGCRTADQALALGATRSDERYLPGAVLPDGIAVRTAADLDFASADLVVLRGPRLRPPRRAGRARRPRARPGRRARRGQGRRPARRCAAHRVRGGARARAGRGLAGRPRAGRRRARARRLGRAGGPRRGLRQPARRRPARRRLRLPPHQRRGRRRPRRRGQECRRAGRGRRRVERGPQRRGRRRRQGVRGGRGVRGASRAGGPRPLPAWPAPATSSPPRWPSRAATAAPASCSAPECPRATSPRRSATPSRPWTPSRCSPTPCAGPASRRRPSTGWPR